MKKLKARFDPRLRSYAIAAASGAALLAPASMQGAVVYQVVNQTILYGQSVSISFNKQGTPDFTVTETNQGDNYGRLPVISLFETEPGHELAAVSGAPATAFRPGAIIGPSVTFNPVQQALLASGYSSSEYGSLHGPFANTRAYAGVVVKVQGLSFYGWIRIQTFQDIADAQVVTKVLDYAYQTTPNLPIIAGQGIPQQGAMAPGLESSLGALAFGARSIDVAKDRE